MNRKTLSLCLAFVLLAMSSAALAGFTVCFDQAVYSITAGSTFQANILFIPDQGDSLPTGLSSMGFMASFDPINASVADENSIVLPDAINSDGLMGAAPKTVTPGQAGAFGAIDFFAADGYQDSLLASISITDLNTTSNSYSLNLDYFFQQPMTNFSTDFGATPLDELISFGSARVNVTGGPTTVPAPGALILGCIGLANIAWLRKRLGVK